MMSGKRVSPEYLLVRFRDRARRRRHPEGPVVGLAVVVAGEPEPEQERQYQEALGDDRRKFERQGPEVRRHHHSPPSHRVSRRVSGSRIQVRRSAASQNARVVAYAMNASSPTTVSTGGTHHRSVRSVRADIRARAEEKTPVSAPTAALTECACASGSPGPRLARPSRRLRQTGVPVRGLVPTPAG